MMEWQISGQDIQAVEEILLSVSFRAVSLAVLPLHPANKIIKQAIIQTIHFFLISYRSFRLNRNQSDKKQQRCEYPNFLSYQTLCLHFKCANPLLDSYKL